MGGKLQMLSGPLLMQGVFSLSVQGCCRRHCSCLFSCMVVRLIWREERSSRIRAVLMDNLRGLLGIRKMGIVPNTWIRELWMKRYIKVFSDVTAKLKKWKIIGLIKGCMWESVRVCEVA